jgi:uncharacterized membrane protein YbhN (UPF0104 family)
VRRRGPVRRVVVALASLAAAGLLALAHAHGAVAAVRVLADTQVTFAVALLGLAAACPILESRLLRAGQATVGARLGHWEAVRLAAGIRAANLTIRAAGVAGLGVLLGAQRDGSVDRVARSAAYVLGREVAHIASGALVLAALALLGADGRLSPMIVGGAGVFLLSRAMHVGLLWCAATHPQALPRWRRLDRLRALAPTVAVALRSAAAHRRRLLRIAAWAIAVDAVRIGCLLVALQAVGAHTSLDVAIETYGSVVPLAMISILPAGLGAVDAGLVATLQHSGVTVAAAAASVLLFRVAELWVPLAAGAGPALAATRSTRQRRRRLGRGSMWLACGGRPGERSASSSLPARFYGQLSRRFVASGGRDPLGSFGWGGGAPGRALKKSFCARGLASPRSASGCSLPGLRAGGQAARAVRWRPIGLRLTSAAVHAACRRALRVPT